MNFDLKASEAMLELTEEQLAKRLEIEGGPTDTGVKYEGIEGLSQYYNPAVFPGRVYVGSDRVEMVYVPSGPALAGVSRGDLEKLAGTEPTLLRSRAGKACVHYVHPEQGLAYSSDDDEVCFVEVFRPRSLDAYEAEIYRDPGPFIR